MRGAPSPRIYIMSEVYDRNKNPTQFVPVDNAGDLGDEVAAYVGKEKYVPKKWRYLLGEDLIRKADQIYDYASYANEMNTKKEPAKRREYWKLAMASCRQLDRRLKRLKKVNPAATVESMREILRLLTIEKEAIATRLERERG